MKRPMPKSTWFQFKKELADYQIKTGILDKNELIFEYNKNELDGMHIDPETYNIFSSLASIAIRQHYFRESKGMSHQDPNR